MTAFKRGPCVDPIWASTQPLRELLVAAGFARRALPALARRRALGLAWSAQDLQASLQDDAAIKEIRQRDLLVWIPVGPRDLGLTSRYERGVLLIRQADEITLLRLHEVTPKELSL